MSQAAKLDATLDAFAQALLAPAGRRPYWVNQNTKDWTVSLTTVDGRERFELAIGNYQRGMLTGSNPKSATLVKCKDGSHYIQIGVATKPPEQQNTAQVQGLGSAPTNSHGVRFDLTEWL